MKCQEWSQRISRKLDGELPARDEEELRKHLAVCKDCQREERVQRRIREAMSRMAAPAVEPRLRRQLTMAIRTEAERAPQQVIRISAFHIGAIAAILILCVALVILGNRWRDAESALANHSSGRAPVSAVVPPSPLERVTTLTGGAEASVNVQDQVLAFSKIQEFWRGAMRWMAVDGNQAAMGISTPNGPEAASDAVIGKVIVLTFKYVRQNADGASAALANPQFVLVPGEEASATLTPEGEDASPCRYRVRAIAETPGRIRVNLTFEGKAGGADFNTTTSLLVTDGAKEPVLAGATGDESTRWALYLWAEERPVPAEAQPAGVGGRL